MHGLVPKQLVKNDRSRALVLKDEIFKCTTVKNDLVAIRIAIQEEVNDASYIHH